MNQSDHLAANALANDPRIAEAKKLVLDAVKEHQKKLPGVRPSNPALKQSYADLISQYESLRGNKLWHPYLGSGFGKGALVELLDGSIKYDFISGIGVHYWGHSHPEIILAGIDAAISDTIMQGHLQQNGDAVQLSSMLVKLSGMDHCFLSTSGAMANENALKISLQKRSPANRILAFENCFAGRTWALSQITDKTNFREGIPLNVFVDYIPFYDIANPEKSIKNAVNVLKQHLERYPKQHALMLFEMVQGERGFYPGSHDFFAALMAILKENNVTILADEVQTFGRTPALFAFQHFGLEKFVDIVTIGKLSQACATLYKKDHNPRPGLLSQTFLASTSAIKASIAILKGLVEGNYFGADGKISCLHRHFAAKLKEIESRHPQKFHGPYGIGSMIAFTPFDGEAKRTSEFAHALFEAGVISFIAGNNPTRVRFLVPVGAISTDEIDEVAHIIESVLIATK